MRMRLNSSMRNLFGKVALVLALLIATIAGQASACPAHATGVNETSVQTLVRGADAAHLEDMDSSGQLPPGWSQFADDPSDDSEPDNLGTEREVPGAVLGLGAAGLDAPHSSRLAHPPVEATPALTRAVPPAVQPPRG